jgi:hypothetical protein
MFVMPGLVPGIHVFLSCETKDVDGRDEPGHDGLLKPKPELRRLRLKLFRQPRTIEQMRRRPVIAAVPCPDTARGIDFTGEKPSHRSRLTLSAMLALY